MDWLRLMFALTVAASCGVVAGCDTLDFAQYKISGAAPRPSDRAIVVTLTNAAASKADLVERRAASSVGDTLVYFAEPVEHFPTTLGARVVDDNIVVDLACFHPGPGRSKAFAAVRKVLDASLSDQFGSRLSIVNDSTKAIPLRTAR
jgi:hypothetical protein